MTNDFFQECKEQNRSLFLPLLHTLLDPCTWASCPVPERCLPAAAEVFNGSRFPCLHLCYTNHQCHHILVQWESTLLFIFGVCFLSQPPALPDFPWMLAAWKLNLGLSFDFLPRFPSAWSQALRFSGWGNALRGFEVEVSSFAKGRLFQNSSYAAVAKQNETPWGRTRVEEQEGQYICWQGLDKSNSEKNNPKREQEKYIKIQMGKMLSLQSKHFS